MIWPLLISSLFFCITLFSFGNYVDLVFYFYVLFSIFVSLASLISIFRRKLKLAIMQLLAVFVFCLAVLPPFLNFRMRLIDFRNEMAFLIKRNSYLEEVSQLTGKRGKHKEWILGHSNGDEYRIIFDDTEELDRQNRSAAKSEKCSTFVVRLEQHFYAAHYACP